MSNQLFDRIAAKITAMHQGRPLMVGIDGVDGAGKSSFAIRLADHLQNTGRSTLHGSIDYFHNPRAIRHQQGKDAHVSFFEDSFNYEALKAKLLDPIKRGEERAYLRHYDHRADSEVHVEPTRISPNSILIFDGIFLHRGELKEYWDFSIFLDVPFDVTYSRMKIRDGCPADPNHPENARYFRGQHLYLDSCNPRESASIIIDNSNYENPRVISESSENRFRA